MAKNTKGATKIPKKRSSKYSKLAAVAAKELSAKKAALVRAEKALAKAQKTHQELLGEVARLDMLDRSLKALINGTEPPQNVKYVYTYPNWVWMPAYQNWYTYPYNGTYTINLGNVQTTQTQTGLWQGQTSNLTTTGCNSVTTTNAVNLGTINTAGSNSFVMNTADSGSIGYNSSGITSGYSLTTPSSTITANSPGFSTYTFSTDPAADYTVDLSTGQADPEAVVEEIKTEEVFDLKVGSGG